MTKQELPEVQLYSIGPKEADYAAPLLTGEAVAYLKSDEAFGMALVEEGEARAAACARISSENEEVLELISLYVAPEFRRCGLGGTLLNRLLEEAMAATDGSLKWVVSTFTPQMEGIEALFSKAGFRMEPQEQMISWQLQVADIADSPLLKHRAPVPEGYFLRSLEGLSDTSVRQLVEQLKQNYVDDLTAAEIRQALQASSYVLLDQGMEPKACAIFSAQGDKGIYLSQFFVSGGSPARGMIVLQAGGKALLEQFPGDTVLEIPTLAESSENLVKKLIPTSRPEYLMRAVLDLTGE